MKKIVYTLLALAPIAAFAQATVPDFAGVGTLITNILNLVNKAVPFLFAVAVLYFMWGVVNFIRNAGDAKAQEAGRSQMIWGIIGLVVMVSVYGLIGWVQGTFSIGNGSAPVLPTIPTKN